MFCLFGVVDGVSLGVSESVNNSVVNVSVVENATQNVSVNVTVNSSNVTIVPLVRDPNKDYLFYDNLDCFLTPDNICCLTVEVARQQLRVNRPMCHNYTCIANPNSLHICGICPEVVIKSGQELENNNVSECDDMPFIETNPQEIRITYEGVDAINVTVVETRNIHNDLNEKNVAEVLNNQNALIYIGVGLVILLIIYVKGKPKPTGYGRGGH